MMISFFAMERRDRRAAGAVSLLLTVLGLFDLRTHFGMGFWSALAVGFLQGLPILWCRRSPVVAWSMVLTACVWVALSVHPPNGALPWPWPASSEGCVLAALAIAGLELTRRETLALAAMFLAATIGLAYRVDGANFVATVGYAVGGAAIVIAALETLRGTKKTRELLVEQEEISEVERTRRAQLEERARIGRELHDVVAHHMSLIAVQAETAPYRFPGQGDDTKEEFLAISAAAREALMDMRRLLGLLRGDADSVQKTPQPSITEIPALVYGTSDAELVVNGGLDDIPTIVGVTAYRIVQESLSNARRHAPGAPVAVELTRTSQALGLEIRNDRNTAVSSAVAPAPSSQTGLGLTGMQERVGLLDGLFAAGPRDDGGFTVAAVLPLRP